MKIVNDQLVLLKEDHSLLLSYLSGAYGKNTFDKHNATSLKAELKKAKLVSKDKFPSDVVRLNSAVKIKSEVEGRTIQLKLVTPDHANIKEGMISVLAPIGTALIGLRKGQRVQWMVPAGLRTFTILDVVNEK